MADAHLIPVEAERAVIGQILRDPALISLAAQFMKSEHFGDATCRSVYDACLSLWRSGTGVDILTASDAVRKGQKKYDPAPFVAMAECLGSVVSTVHFGAHCEIVREHYASRVLRETADALISGTSGGSDPLSLIAPANEALAKASMADDATDVNAGELAFRLMNESTRTVPIYLGMGALDEYVWMLPGNMVTIRAEAGVGKTAFVLSAVANLLPILRPWIVSLEMPASELVMRLLCQMAEVDIDMALRGHMSDDERDRMSDMASRYADTLSRIDIDDSGSMSADEFMAKAEHRVKNGTQLIVVDYAQLMNADKKLYPTQTTELEAISKCIRATARKLNVPILCVVHVNKQGEDHGTSQFEKDAHVRIHLSRDVGSHVMNVDVLKNRNGKPGPCEVPVLMRYGMVGRTFPPSWCGRPRPMNYNPTAGIVGNPDTFTAPKRDTDDAPF